MWVMCIKLFNWCQLAAFAARFSPLLLTLCAFLSLYLYLTLSLSFPPSTCAVLTWPKTLASDTVCKQVGKNSDLHGVTPPQLYATVGHTLPKADPDAIMTVNGLQRLSGVTWPTFLGAYRPSLCCPPPCPTLPYPPPPRYASANGVKRSFP